jgi:hypothetical protein
MRSMQGLLLALLAGCANATSGSRDSALDGSSSVVICAGVPCPQGQDCCLVTGQCFDPSISSGACPAPSMDGGVTLNPWNPNAATTPCNASSQCRADEYCGNDQARACLAEGHCMPRNVQNTCDPGSLPREFCQVCGCDGITYADQWAAQSAGVRFAVSGPCGVDINSLVDAGPTCSGCRVVHAIGCGTNAQCPPGQECCQALGQCYDPSCPTCCRLPPPGTRFPCMTDSDCASQEYCLGDGCSGPGGCVHIASMGACNGESAPVCGCNGRSYINACHAAAVPTRIAHPGSCP